MSFFLIICIIPLVVIGSTSVLVSVRSTRESAIEFSDSTLQQIRTRIEAIMNVAETVSYQLVDDAVVQSTLRRPLYKDVVRRYETDLSMDTYLDYELTYIEELDCFYVIGANKCKYKSAYNSFLNQDLTEELWYISVMSTSEPVWFSAHKDSFAVQTSGQKFISMGMRINDLTSNRYLGVVLVDIELEKIDQILYDSFGDLGQVIIIDENNRIVTGTSTLSGEHFFALEDAIAISDRDDSHILSGMNNSIILQYPLSNSGWRVIGLIPSANIVRDSFINVMLLIGLTAIMSILSYYIAKVISSTITRPVNDMIRQMREVESGNFNVSTGIHYDDEIGKLSDSFNKMTVQVSNLMDRIVEEQQKLRKYELRALQSQINPHFLYNTLDSVVWLARMKQHEEIVKIVNAMTQLFRISLSRGKDIITIEEEMDHVSSYLTIQKFRYRTHFNYDIDIPASIRHYKTQKLILQPLVENAIYHGLKVKRGGGDIHIRGEEHEDCIVFKVIDTGVGMSPETLDDINRTFSTNSDSQITMYGIKNVNDRIRIFFGEAYGLRFDSISGEGTTAIITIPKYSGDERYA